jgi:hypothetical protein
MCTVHRSGGKINLTVHLKKVSKAKAPAIFRPSFCVPLVLSIDLLHLYLHGIIKS